jgi:hypothetical protein
MYINNAWQRESGSCAVATGTDAVSMRKLLAVWNLIQTALPLQNLTFKCMHCCLCVLQTNLEWAGLTGTWRQGQVRHKPSGIADNENMDSAGRFGTAAVITRSSISK